MWKLKTLLNSLLSSEQSHKDILKSKNEFCDSKSSLIIVDSLETELDKTTKKIALIEFGLIAVLAFLVTQLFVACDSLSPYTIEELNQQTPAQVEQIVATTPVESITDAPAVQTLPMATNAVVMPSQPEFKQVKVSIRPEIQTAIETAKTINQIANPTPTAPLVNLGLNALGWLLGIGAGITAAIKNKQLKTLSGVTATITQAIEKLPDDVGTKVKSAVTTLSQIVGNSSNVHSTVQKLTN